MRRSTQADPPTPTVPSPAEDRVASRRWMPTAAMLFERMADAVYLLEPDSSRILWTNRSACAMLGMPPHEVLAHSVLSLQKDVAGLPQWADIAAVVRRQSPYTFVGRHCHADGREVPVEVITTAFHDGGREFFLSVARDISRRTALDADLKRRENQLWYALNEAADGLWDWNVGTGEVFFSPQLKRMLGYGPDEMAPRLSTWSTNVHPDDAPQVMAALGSHLDGRSLRYEAEYRLRNRNGGWLWVHDRGRVCERDADGRPTRTVGMVQDITARRETLDALARSEAEQRTLIAALPDTVIRFDAQGKHLYVSDNGDRHWFATPQAMLGRRCADLGLRPDVAAAIEAAITRVCTDRQPQDITVTMEGRDGPRTVNWRLVAEQALAGAPATVLAVCRDVTESHAAAAELERHRHHLQALVEERTAALSIAKEAAEAASRAKSSFLANVSHELRTPLTAIIGMTSLALARVDDPMVRDQLSKAAQASQHLLQLIGDILDLSKIEAERLTIESLPFRLGSVLDGVLQLTAQRAAEKGLQLECVVDAQWRDRPLVGDPLRLKQVLLNLVDNAIKFTPRGRVVLGVREEAPVRPGDAPRLWFEVVDTGIGIAPEAVQRLFQPFEQADNSMSRRHGGTGLGLAISKRLVELMGGTIGVYSNRGLGTTFWCRLPLRPADAAAEAPAPAAASLDEPASALPALRQRHEGARVLLVDDEPVAREVAHCMLEMAGLAVQVAADGHAALAITRREPLALIVMDMQMPQLDGLATTRAIRASGPNRHTPILALTANAYDDDRRRCEDAGMDGHLAKPLAPEQLYRTLLETLDRGGHR